MKIVNRYLKTLGAIAFVALLTGWDRAAAADPPPQEKHSVVLILLDGFRWDSVDPELTPTLYRLAKTGIQGEMVPVWPPISTPNHWALVTGLYPIHSGPFHNLMYDPARKRAFDPSDAGLAEGEPIWAGVVRSGGISCVIRFWGGVGQPEAWKKPSYLVPFAEFGTPIALQLLDQPSAFRPDLLTLFNYAVDKAQHLHGVRSAEADEAKRKADRDVAGLIEGLAERKMTDRVDVVIVADHGALDTPNLVYLDELNDPDKLAVPPIGNGPVTALWPKPGQEQAVYDQVRERFPHLKPYRPHEIPKRYNCCEPSRVPPILLLADPGWQMVDRDSLAIAATHGFDNALPEMHAVFIANGPSFRSDVNLGKFNNVDVYSLLTELLHVRPKSSDGSIDAFCAALKVTPASCGAQQR